MLVQVGKRGGFPDPTHTARVFKKLLYNYHRELTYLQVLLQKPIFIYLGNPGLKSLHTLPFPGSNTERKTLQPSLLRS
jgi:hypothetical protein